MIRLEHVLREAARELDAAGSSWAMVGGLAVSARAEPRFTRDVDLAVTAADDAAAEAVVLAQREAGYRLVASLEHEASGRLATARLQPPGEPEGGIVVDLLFASSGIEPEIVAEAQPIAVLSGLEVPVARTGHLIALKLLADSPDRPQDRADLLALVGHADAGELALAQRALATISERGFARGRDLAAAYRQLVR